MRDYRLPIGLLVGAMSLLLMGFNRAPGIMEFNRVPALAAPSFLARLGRRGIFN